MLTLVGLLFICIYSAGLTMSLHARHLKEYDGKKISQSEIQIFTNVSKIECFAECGRDKDCLSVQLYPDGQTCVTLRERFKNVDVTSTAVPGYQLAQTDKPVSAIGSDCDLDVDCKSLLNSNCHKGSCRCDVGHRPDGNTCRKDPAMSKTGDSVHDVERSCTISHGHLFRPDTQSKQDKLKVLLEQLALESFWIGARHDDGDGNCADLHWTLNYKTNDASCKDNLYNICEIPQN